MMMLLVDPRLLYNNCHHVVEHLVHGLVRSCYVGKMSLGQLLDFGHGELLACSPPPAAVHCLSLNLCSEDLDASRFFFKKYITSSP